MRRHPLSGRFRQPAWWLAALLVTALAGCSLDQPVDTPAPTPSSTPAAPGVSLGTAITIPAVHVPGGFSVVAGTGDRFIVLSELASVPGQYSPDNGRTWEALPKDVSVRSHQESGGGPSFGSHLGYQGTFAGVVQAPEPDYSYTGLQRWDPDTGKVTFYPYDLDVKFEGDDDTAVYPVDYVGTAIVLADGRIFDISGDQAVPRTPRFAAIPTRLVSQQYGLTKDGATVVRSGRAESGEYGYLSIAPIDGSAEGVNIRIPGLLSMDVSALTIHYLVGTTSSLRVCKAKVATPTNASCTTLATGNYRASKFGASLTTSMGADQVFLSNPSGDSVRQWLVREGKATLVTKTWKGWTWLPFRDAAEPMALIQSGDDQAFVASVISRNGKPRPLFTAPATLAQPYGTLLSTGRVTYQQEHYSAAAGLTRSLWSRTLADGKLGAEEEVSGKVITGAFASAGRTVTQLDRAHYESSPTIEFFDAGALSGTFAAGKSGWLSAFSGPYAVIGQEAVRADGYRYSTGPVLTLFGSLVVEASARGEQEGRTFQLRDLERPDADPIRLDLPQPAGRIYRDDSWVLAGDWVVAGYIDGDEYEQLAFNYRSGKVVPITGYARIQAVVGDWALVSDAEKAELRDLVSGDTLPISSRSIGQLVTDGTRAIAWEDEAGAHIAELTGLPAAAPRLLGTIGAHDYKLGTSPWAPQFDLTTAAAPGRLEVRNPSGDLVATLTTPASPEGSLRGLSWDGTSSSGTPVEPGDYTWTLVVTAPDSDEPATAVDGQRPATGTLTITA